jgi:hypothetical protein
MNGQDAAGLSPFEARPALQAEHLRMTVRDLSALRDPRHCNDAADEAQAREGRDSKVARMERREIRGARSWRDFPGLRCVPRKGVCHQWR